MPRLSVIMPTYNTKEEYLREAIESILTQTFTDFEFLIIDDGSTNNTEQVVLSYDDARIKYVKNKKNLGLVTSLNKAFHLACGEYIARMDADDISLPQRFEKQILYLDANPEVSLLGTAMQIFPDIRDVYLPTRVTFLGLLEGCIIAHPTIMYKKACFEKHGLLYDEEYKHAEDYELWSRAIRYIEIRNLDTILLRYRQHQDQISTSHSSEQHRKALKAQQNMRNYLTDSQSLQAGLEKLIHPPTLKKYKIYLFGVLPILKIKTYRNKKWIYLFGFLPILKIK